MTRGPIGQRYGVRLAEDPERVDDHASEDAPIAVGRGAVRVRRSDEGEDTESTVVEAEVHHIHPGRRRESFRLRAYPKTPAA